MVRQVHRGWCLGLALGLIGIVPLAAQEQDAVPISDPTPASMPGQGPEPPSTSDASLLLWPPHALHAESELAAGPAQDAGAAAAIDTPALPDPAMADASGAEPAPGLQPDDPVEVPVQQEVDRPAPPPPGDATGATLISSIPLPAGSYPITRVAELPDPRLPPEVDAFYDFNVGLGVVIMTDFDDGRVESAAVRKGTIVIERADSVRLGVMLEAHRMFRLLEDSDRFGHGPYVGLVAGEDIVEAVSVGWMLAMRRRDSSQSMNINLGVFLDPAAKVLADDFQEGAHFKTDGQVLYKEEPMWGWLIGASFGF